MILKKGGGGAGTLGKIIFFRTAAGSEGAREVKGAFCKDWVRINAHT